MAGQAKILVIKPSSLGDIVHGLWVVSALKNFWKDVSIHWVVRDSFAEIVAACPFVDRIFLFHRGSGLQSFIELIREVRRQRYDYVFDMQGLARSGVMTLCARSKRKIGRSDAREFAWLAYDTKVSLPDTPDPHAIDILLQFLPAVGLPAELPPRLELHIEPTDRFEGLTEPSDCPKILLFPESRRTEKEWPYFSELASVLGKKLPNFRIIIVGQRPFYWSGEEKNVRILSEKTSIGDMVLLIEKGALVVANDSAPLHLASALNVPVVALFGPTNPKRSGPYPLERKNSHVIRSKGSDMSSIGVEEVVAGAERVLFPCPFPPQARNP
jgi:ADP-heptose:LPS heptosyltransferase